MPGQLPPQPEEREQGAVAEQEMQAQMNPVTPQEEPTVAPPAELEPEPQQAQGQTQPPMPPQQRQSNPWLVPMNPNRGQKMQAERQRDAALLWEVLAASSPNPTIRNIAQALAGEE